MAYIVIKGADFSANPLKKISIVTEFSEFTKAVFARVGITTNTKSAIQVALNKFFNTMNSAGLFASDKITSLCMPFLSEIDKDGDLAYAQLNVLDGNNFFTSAIAGSLELSNHGLKVVVGGSVKYVEITNYASVDDFHFAFYNMEDEAMDGSERYVLGNSGSFLYIQRQASANKFKARSTASLNIWSGDANASKFGVAFMQSDKIGRLYYNGAVAEAASAGTYGSASVDARFATYTENTYTDNSDLIPYGILSIGHALTTDECKTYESAVKTLMESVGSLML